MYCTVALSMFIVLSRFFSFLLFPVGFFFFFFNVSIFDFDFDMCIYKVYITKNMDFQGMGPRLIDERMNQSMNIYIIQIMSCITITYILHAYVYNYRQ